MPELRQNYFTKEWVTINTGSGGGVSPKRESRGGTNKLIHNLRSCHSGERSDEKSGFPRRRENLDPSRCSGWQR